MRHLLHHGHKPSCTGLPSKPPCFQSRESRPTQNKPACNWVWTFSIFFICILIFQSFVIPVCGLCEEVTTNTPNLVSDSPLINEARETASLITSIVKVVGALILVLGLMLLSVQLMRKFGMGNRQLSHGPLIKVLDTRMIAPKKHVAVLDVAGEFIAVGITDQQVNLLTKLMDNTQLSEAANKVGGGSGLAQYTPSFSALLNKAVHGLKKQN